MIGIRFGELRRLQKSNTLFDSASMMQFLSTRCNLTDNALCGSCLLTNEDALHCLRDCHFAREICKTISIRYTRHFFSISMTKDWIKEGLQSQPPQVFLYALWWWVWSWRNHRILGDNQWRSMMCFGTFIRCVRI